MKFDGITRKWILYKMQIWWKMQFFDKKRLFITYQNNNNNNDRLTAFDPGQPG